MNGYLKKPFLIRSAVIAAALFLMTIAATITWHAKVSTRYDAQAKNGQRPIEGLPAALLEYHCDFGIVEEGDTAVCSVEINNPTPSPLNIISADISCSCLSVDDCLGLLPSRATRSITLRLDASGYKGVLKKAALLGTDSQALRHYHIIATAAIRGSWVTQPNMTAGTLRPGEQSRLQTHLCYVGDINPTQPSLNYSGENLYANASPFTRVPGYDYPLWRSTLVLQCKALNQAGASKEEIVVTSRNIAATHRVEVKWNTSFATKATPPQVVFDVSRQDATLVRTVTLTPHGEEHTMDAYSVSCELPCVSAFITMQDSNETKIEVSLSKCSHITEVVRSCILVHSDGILVQRIPILILGKK